MYVKRLLTGSAAVLAAATLATTLSAAGDAKPPRIVAAVMQDTDGDGRGDRLGLLYSERVRHAAEGTVSTRSWSPVTRSGPWGQRAEHARAPARGEGGGRRWCAALRPVWADESRFDPRPGSKPGAETGVPVHPSARKQTPCAPACHFRRRLPAIATVTESSMRRIAHRRIRKSGPERRTRRTSRSSTRIATASMGTRSARSSPRRWARTRTRAPRQRPSARSRRRSSRPRSPTRMCTRRPVTTATSRRPVASASTAATTPRPGDARSCRSRRSAALRRASMRPVPPGSCFSI